MGSPDRSEPKPERQPVPPTGIPHGSFDGKGAGDHDEPYFFGRRLNHRSFYPFSERQFLRLVILRSRIMSVFEGGDRSLFVNQVD